MFELLNRGNIHGGQIRLYSRSKEGIEQNIQIAKRICEPRKQPFLITAVETLDEALDGADIILYGATSKLEDYGDYKPFGIAQGAHILHVADKASQLCPDAWILVSTNPPEIPLSAAYQRFKLNKV